MIITKMNVSKPALNTVEEMIPLKPVLKNWHADQMQALAKAREFSQTTQELQNAVGKLESSCRAYLEELKKIDTRPLMKKTRRLVHLADKWAELD